MQAESGFSGFWCSGKLVEKSWVPVWKFHTSCHSSITVKKKLNLPPDIADYTGFIDLPCILVLTFSVPMLWAIMFIHDGWASTWALPCYNKNNALIDINSPHRCHTFYKNILGRIFLYIIFICYVKKHNDLNKTVGAICVHS